MGTKITFPYLCRYKKQWNELVKFLSKKGVRWGSGRIVQESDYKSVTDKWTSTYLIYDFNREHGGSSLYYFTCDENTTIKDVFNVCFRKKLYRS